ncbi:hypothetical protein C8J56DRAFT_357738 [Mycena floridula]|nr:hypothetical protein C8J56DRAFT_357738 [Mycena floridula]
MSDLLVKLCQNEETRQKAQGLIHVAKMKTTAGSGYQLKDLAVGLPAVCAYMASEELQNGDVEKQQAQRISCLKMSDFDKCYNIVKAALEASVERRTRSSSGRFYDKLIEAFKINITPEYVLGWLQKAEARYTLITQKPVSEEIKYGIFFWLLDIIGKGKAKSDLTKFATKCSLPTEYHAGVQKTHDILHKSGGPVADQIQDDLNRIRGGQRPKNAIVTPSTSPRKSPAKGVIPRRMPTGNSPQKRDADPEGPVATPAPSPQKSPSRRPVRELPTKDSPQKRTRIIAETEIPETPSKRPKVSKPSQMPMPIIPHKIAPSSPSKRRKDSHIESEVDAMDVDDEDVEMDFLGEPEEDKLTSRYRPAFADQQQWNSLRAETAGKRLDKLREIMFKRYGRPFQVEQ